MSSRCLRFVAATILALSGALGVGVGLVSAHAQYTSSTPPPNATLASAPASVQITFSQELSDIKMSISGPHRSEVTTAPAKFYLEHRQTARVTMHDDGPVSGGDGDPNVLENSASRSQGPFLLRVFGSPGQLMRTYRELYVDMGPAPGPDLPHAWQKLSPQELLGEARQHYADPTGLGALRPTSQ